MKWTLLWRSQGCLWWVVGCLMTAGQTMAAEAPPPAPLTLDEMVAEVSRHHPELAFYRAEIAAAKAGRKTSAQWSNPELSAELGSKRVWERGGASLGDGPAWSVAVAQPFEFPGRLALRKAIANRQVELAELGCEQFQAALAARTRSLGYGAMVAREKAAAAREVAGRFQALLEVLVQRDPAGVAPLLDTRIIEATALVMHRRASQAAQETQSALMELNQLRGQPPAAPLSIAALPLLPTNLPPLAVLTERARTHNFEIRMRTVELAQQGLQVQLNRNERWPQITLAPFYAAEKANDEQRVVGLGVAVPLPLWNRNNGPIQAAQARLQQAEASMRATWRQIERQVAHHAVALETQLEEMNRWQADTQGRFREAAELADRHYRLGAVPVTSYVEMQTRYLEALEALLATRAEALDHRQQLELLVGQPLDAFN